MNKYLSEYTHIEEEFFDIDKEKRIAHIKLKFDSPSDIFDKNYISKHPVLSDDFFDWVGSVFDIIPSKYKINLEITFENMEEWDEKSLLDVFNKNMFLEYKTVKSREKKKNRIAYSLVGLGLMFFAAMLLINHFWEGESVLKEIFSYVSDIATTVILWEAMSIIFVERRENSSYRNSLLGRFASIKFLKAEATADPAPQE